MKKRWIILMAFMVLFAVLGLVLPESASWSSENEPIDYANVAWMITATIFVLMMTPGLSFFYGGMVRAKNVISTMLQSFMAMGIISIIWVVIGFSLAFGDDIGGFIGNPFTYFMFRNVGAHIPSGNENLSGLGLTIPLALYALFQMKFAIITPSLITGSFAERVHFSAYLVFMALFCLFVYCPLAHWTWHPDGFLNKMLVKDFAGGIVVHASSGVAALVGALFLGRRKQSTKHVPANIPFVMLGAGMLWLGWFGFNGGSSLAADSVAVKAFLNTNIASATAMIVWILFDCLRGHKPSAMGAAVGAVVGLVSITPSAGWVSVGQSICIAFITALVCNIAIHWKNKTNVDDALDVFPTHGIGGILGTILTGVFVYETNEISYFHSFLNHLLSVIIVIVYTFLVTYALYWITNKMIKMRVSEKNEKVGLDMSQHDELYGVEMLTNSRELAEYELTQD
ncbi:MAG: ammonium transporter [Paludibacteraceae bacterium]|jgi:ammonium transporter, Amt family|nr:ammonium transporter [Paludibacteraceae bacterium]OQA46018.1 MAG: Ammonia channel precursor [Bacteroidetes bacterium ADurb.Bin302]HOH95748.1 ammonium transporter [Candidatus Enterocola sp.]HPG55258.1 ammonium transporter [Candidatus Enterocola sp.]